MPEWAKFVKTGVSKQRPPADLDWWFARAASILRAVENKGPIGVAKLKSKYGSKKNNGMAPEHFRKASGKIIRTILQQLETAKLLKQEAKGVHKGRVITPEGQKLLFGTSKELVAAMPKKKEAPKVIAKPVEKKIEVKAEAKPEVKKDISKVEVKKDTSKVAEKKPEPVKEVPKVEVKETPKVEIKKEAPKTEAPEKKVE
jgi:small subunit ribosomal protein S19e